MSGPIGGALTALMQLIVLTPRLLGSGRRPARQINGDDSLDRAMP